MDAATMQKLARFKIMTRRLGGFNVDIFRMAQDADYAREVLSRAHEVDNETLVLLALELSDALNLLDGGRVVAQEKPGVVAPAVSPELEVSKARYAWGARG